MKRGFETDFIKKNQKKKL